LLADPVRVVLTAAGAVSAEREFAAPAAGAAEGLDAGPHVRAFALSSHSSTARIMSPRSALLIHVAGCGGSPNANIRSAKPTVRRFSSRGWSMVGLSAL